MCILIQLMPAKVNIKVWHIFLVLTHASCLCFELETLASLGQKQKFCLPDYSSYLELNLMCRSVQFCALCTLYRMYCV